MSKTNTGNDSENSLAALMELGPRILLLGIGSLGCYLVAKTQQQLVERDNGIDSRIEYALCHHKAFLLQDKPDVHTFLLADNNAPLAERLLANGEEGNITALQALLFHYDLVLLCGALGGKSGATLAEIGLLLSPCQAALAFVVTPFNFEGGARLKQARATLQQLETCCNGLLELPNDLLRKALGATTTLDLALDASNGFLTAMLRQLLHIMAKPSLINLDMNDLLGLLRYRGRIAINWQPLDFSQPLAAQVLTLLQHPLLVITATDTAKTAMLHVEVPEHFELEAFEQLHSLLQQHLPDNLIMLSGLRITTGLATPEVTLLLTGISPE
ncbi:hypothetical protein JAO78_007375 [Alishewanella sp. 16-MA]|uniref:Tubulin/FtsZ GTPase domain-containing protein n=1 Tax=Alishewanella maricola TaxID=2795740 RepID=A0ABS8C2R8_9ALTE|nr:hypothetical protein [Alishewanella maricola]MCB5226636.1 hypothetical protein [Alishewanella maricola]